MYVCIYIYYVYTHAHTYIHTFELASNMLNDLSLSLTLFLAHLGTEKKFCNCSDHRPGSALDH